jgi:hypothetical protein
MRNSTADDTGARAPIADDREIKMRYEFQSQQQTVKLYSELCHVHAPALSSGIGCVRRLFANELRAFDLRMNSSYMGCI